MFCDFCDVSGLLPKVKVGDAVRCLGENPLQSEVTRTDITNLVTLSSFMFRLRT